MEKRTLLTMFLLVLIFWAAQELLWKKRVPPQPTASTADSVQAQKADSAATTKPSSSSSLSTAPVADTTGTGNFMDAAYVAKINGNRTENDTLAIENNQMRVLFSNRGGTIAGVILKDYKLSDKKTPINLIPNGQDLFDLALKVPEGQKKLSELKFEHEIDPNGQAITFFIQRDSVRIIERRYELAANYDVKFTLTTNTEAERNGGIDGYQILWNSGIADTEKPVDDRNNSYAVKAMIDNQAQGYKFGQLKTDRAFSGGVNWAVVRSKYFGLAIIPEKKLNVHDLKAFKDGNSPAITMQVSNRSALTKMEDHYDLYFGPCTYLQLAKYQPTLKPAAEMGWKWLLFLSRFFLWLLTILHKLVLNYGVAIVFFSLILKFLLAPLTKKSLESGQKLQKIQPMIQELQKKYKKDPKQLQIELAKVYKEQNVSPLGGCLPLLLQMPVFFALYPALRYSLELRQAHFVFWLKDLSIPDPYYVLPILMGISMVIQSLLMPKPKQNPEEMDDKQRAAMQSQKLMTWIMPVFMFFIFKSLPSGLVLYWMLFNIYSIVQQYALMKKLQ